MSYPALIISVVGAFVLFGVVLAVDGRMGRRSIPMLTRRLARVHVSGRSLRLLRRCLSGTTESPAASVVQELGMRLTDAILSVQHAIRDLPRLPMGADGRARVMQLADLLAAEGVYASEGLMNGAAAFSEATLTSSERIFLPDCMRAAYVTRLANILSVLQRDERDRRDAMLLARRLVRAKRPMELLSRHTMSGMFLATLLTALRCDGQTALLAALEEYLAGHGTSSEAVAAGFTARQTRIGEDVRLVATALEALTKLNWLAVSAEADPLHELLMQDPAGVYPSMAAESQAALRLRADTLARRFQVTAQRIVETALEFCKEHEAALENHVGYWLMENVSALRGAVGTRHGRVYAWCIQHQARLKRAALWAVALGTGWAFLHFRQPMGLVPFFVVLTGCVSRFVLQRLRKERPVLRMAVTAVTEELRTLVVLPVVLHDSSEAIAMVRYLKTVRQAFPENGVDCLLLGDYAPHLTQRGSEDGPICLAASTAVNALNDASAGQFLYMQRSRVWDEAQHAYAARGDRAGAVQCVCRLIAEGECEDVLDFSSVTPSFLYRHYAFVLTLTPDVRPAPGMLEELLAVAAHPACTRYPTAEGMRGAGILQPGRVAEPIYLSSRLRMLEMLPAQHGFDGVGLIRPDAYLAALDGVAGMKEQNLPLLVGELTGCQQVPEVFAQERLPGTVLGRLERLYRETRRAWSGVMWQFPWVQTASGLVRTPLDAKGRFHLHAALRDAIVPLCQAVMLLYALLSQHWGLLVFSLLAPEVRNLWPVTMEGLLRAAAHTALLPIRMAVRLLGVWEAVLGLLARGRQRPQEEEPPLAVIEVWAQGLAATLCAALGIALPPIWVPALALGAAFGCFPLLHRWLDAPTAEDSVPSKEDEAFLSRVADATWRFFRENVSEKSHHLPPCEVQFDPPLAACDETSPEAIAMYLLSCVAARELGYLTEAAAADRIGATLATLRDLPMVGGLPCRRYRLSALTIADPAVDSAACGLLLAAVMVCAQAMRTWLPACRPGQRELPAKLSEFASSMDIARLYAGGLFHAELDADGQGTGASAFFADETLLLSVAAVARRTVAPGHLARLSGTMVRIGRAVLPVSRHGDASAYLLAGLFLPMDAEVAEAVVRLQQLHGRDGLFGLGKCRVWGFTPDMRYLPGMSGLPEVAVEPAGVRGLFAAYAAALALPVAPGAACGALRHMEENHMLGRLGFCESIDCRGQEKRLVGLYDTWHQGVLLCAAAHVLADAPVQRFFCALPEVEAALPLLHRRRRLVLPAGMRPPQKTPAARASFSRAAFGAEDLGHVGTPDAAVWMDANGNGAMQVDSVRFVRESWPLSGLQCYLADEGRVFRVTEATLPGETVFTGGQIRFERRCGSLRTLLVVTVDPARRRILHALTVTNLSTANRVIEVADCLLAEVGQADMVEAARVNPRRLMLHNRKLGVTLHHTMSASARPEMLAVCTDGEAFCGRGRGLHAPASLEEEMADVLGPSELPCLSFRAQFALGGRGQVTVLFATGLSDAEGPKVSEFPGLLALAEMQGEAIAEAVPLTEAQELGASMLAGPMMQGRVLAVCVESEAGLPLLADALAAAGWARMKGLDWAVCLVCPEKVHEAAGELLNGSFAEVAWTETLPEGALVLREGGGTLAEQARGLHAARAIPVAAAAPVPAKLPEEAMCWSGGYGGFDRETGDYLVTLDVGQTTPAPWRNVHVSPIWREAVDETGLLELVQLHEAGGVVIDPFGVRVPRIMRQGCGQTEWRCWTDKLDLSLTACCMPGQKAGLRVLRLRNATEEALALEVCVAICFDAPPEVLGELAMGCTGCLAGLTAGWNAHRCDIVPDSVGLLHPIAAERGCGALLICRVDLAARGNAEAAWLYGGITRAEQVEAAARALQDSGASAMLRGVREKWAQEMGAIVVSTPEETLDMLMNRILPLQCRVAEMPLADVIPPLTLTAPDRARACLLLCAGRVTGRRARLHLTLAALHYVQVTEDTGVWAHAIGESTLLARCCEAVLSLELDDHRIPAGADAAEICFMAAVAAKGLHRYAKDEALADLARTLRNAADTYLWQDTHYGEGALYLGAQGWAALAEGRNSRPKQAMVTAWRLFDERHGLLRSREADDILAARPGTVNNGGQDTCEAVWALAGLLALGLDDEAWTLLRALNPIHHGDDPLRAEEYAAAPYWLAAGMEAAPARAGRGIGDGAAAAGWLYAVTLEGMLGIRRRGDSVTLCPDVPPDWDGFTVTMRIGGATWHFAFEQDAEGMSIDGIEKEGNTVKIMDDGKVHQVRMGCR